MNINTPSKNQFNKKIFCWYQSTSDDLLFWCWFDVLILSLNYDLTAEQISIVFTVSFWISFFMKFPADVVAKKIGPGRSIMLAAGMFLAAAIFLTFGTSIVPAIIGQSLYLTGLSFQSMSTIIVKNAEQRDPKRVDFISIMSLSETIAAVISLVASLLMDLLFGINSNLPMYICIIFCISSCILAFMVSRYDNISYDEFNKWHEMSPVKILKSLDKSIISGIVLLGLFMVIFTVSGNNLKIMITDSLSAITTEDNTVFHFSIILLVSRVVKIVSNLFLNYSRKKGINPKIIIYVVVTSVFLISVLGILNIRTFGYKALTFAVVAFLFRIVLYDPFRFVVNSYLLQRLDVKKQTDVLFIQSIGVDLLTAIVSGIATLLLHLEGMNSVMLMLLALSLVLLALYYILRKNFEDVDNERA